MSCLKDFVRQRKIPLFQRDYFFDLAHYQKEDAKSAHIQKRVKYDKIEISGLIFMLTTWEYTSGLKITSPKPQVQKIWSKQLISPFSFMANLLSKRLAKVS